MSYLYYLLIYLVVIVALIGCEPLDTCYDDVSGALGPVPEGWQRMKQVGSRLSLYIVLILCCDLFVHLSISLYHSLCGCTVCPIDGHSNVRRSTFQ